MYKPMDACVLFGKGEKMNYKHFGELLRELRESRTMTRERLAEGICTSKQIYRIEKGEYEPSLYLLNMLSIKFNMDLNGYFKMHFSNSSIVAYRGIEKLNAALEAGNLNLIRTLISQYKNHEDFLKGENLQHILYCKSLCSTLLDHDDSQALRYCTKGLVVENPAFSIDTIRENIYSNVGFSLLNCMSRNYMTLGDLHTSMKILEDMLYVIEHYILETPYAMYKSDGFAKKIYQNTLYNLSVQLYKIGNTQEALENVNKGIEFSLKEYNLRFLPELLTIKFRVLYSMEEYTEAKKYYHQAKNLLLLNRQEEKIKEIEELVVSEYPLLLQ